MKISTHVLDTSIGRPAAGVGVELHRNENGRWTTIVTASTTPDGRVAAFAPLHAPLEAGEYRLIFDAGAYFRSRGLDTFYDRIQIDFCARDDASHYHVPLLVSPFGYSTYRGS